MSAWITPVDRGPRCARWKLNWSCGSRGGRHTRTKRFDGTKREANAALRDFEAECERLPLTSTGFVDYANAWNDARLASGAIADATHSKYKYLMRAIKPYLNMALEKVRPGDIQAVYAALNWSGTSLRTLHNSLHRIFRAAIADGLIASSPLDNVDAPRLDTKEKKPLTPQQVDDLLNELDINDCRQFAIALILRSGLRRKEALSVRWCDVYDNVIHIRRETTKTDAGVRDVPIDNETMALIELRRLMIEDALALTDDKLQPTDALCCGLDARPLTVDALRRFWDRKKKDYNCCTIHELRHTYLTNLAQAGVHPAIMQRLAGHSSMRTTMEIYTHVNNDDLRKAVDALAIFRQCAAECASSQETTKNRPDKK